MTRSVAAGPVSDPVLTDGQNYFYLVSDAKAPTEVYSLVASGASLYEDDTITIDGVGFNPSCANNAVYLDGGLAATLLACSTTQLQAEIPSYSISGNVVVVSPNGQSTPQQKLFAVGLRSNPAKDVLAHINVDASHNVFACDQGVNDRIWKIDFTSGVMAQCGGNFGDPVGLPTNEFGRFNASTHSTSAASGGNVRELDPASCTLASWGLSGTGGSDPVDPRALAYDKSGANNSWTFVLDHTGDRIRRRGNMSGMDTMWLTGLGLGGNTAAASDPAGFTFNTAGEFFFTAQSAIKHYSAARTLIQQFTPTDGLNHPGQIETDENGALWIANRDGNNVLRIRTDPINKHVHTKVSGITAPRGIALDRDPGTNEPWLYVADQHQIYRFRIYDSIHVDVKVLNDALVSPSGVKTAQAEFERRVRRDIERARSVYSQCGIDVVLDRVLFMADPNANGGAVEGTAVCVGSPTPQEQSVLAQNRSSNLLAINLYYVHHFTNSGGQSIARSGFAITNDCFGAMNNQTQGGTIVARYASSTPAPGGSLTGAAIDTTPAHEVGHFLLDMFNNGTGDGEHKGQGTCTEATTPGSDPNEFYLMHGTGCSIRRTLSPAECSDMRSNMDESEFVELF